ncbi:MAG: hypothetical protein ABFS38_21605 [Bacteroidota bacterium]
MIQRTMLLFLFCFTGLTSAQEIKQNMTLSNSISESHVLVKGTKVSLIPPNGFTPASQFNGFQQAGSQSSIMVVEIPGPFKEVQSGLTKEALKSQGVMLRERVDLFVNDMSSIYMEGEQFAQGTMFSKYMLIFGRDEFTVMVNAMFPKEFVDDLSADMRNVLLSVVYESEREVDLFENLPYELDVTDTKLKYANTISNMLIYTVDGNIPTQSNDKSTIAVGSSLGRVEIDDTKQYAINRVKQFSQYSDIEILEIKGIEIDDVDGYEITAIGIQKDDSTEEFIYQVMLFSDNLYYIIIGFAEEEYEGNCKLFRLVASTFKRK